MLGSQDTDRTHVRRPVPLRLLLSLAVLAMCVVPGDAVARAPRTSGNGQTQLLLSDMSKHSERPPAGVPSWWDWAQHPRTQPMKPPSAFRAFLPWGQLYQCAGTPSTPRATVELRNMQTWVLARNSARWQRAQVTSDLGGAAFAEDYAGPTLPGRYKTSSDGISAQLVPGHNFHFWSNSGRIRLDSSNVAAVTVALEARLDSDTAPTSNPCLVLSVGGDMWTAAVGGRSSGDVGIGRFKRVERRWRLFTMTTASAELLRRSPVPAMAPADVDF
jgi:hypothetical protein